MIPFRPSDLAAAAFALVVAAGPADAATLQECAAGRTWRAIESEHFTLLTAAPEAEGRALAGELERLAEVLDRVGWSRRCARPVGATVFALDDGDCYTLFGPRFENRPIRSAGHFLPGMLGSMMVLRSTRKDEDLRIIRHEYVHTMAERRDVALPLALNEGVADFFSTFRTSPSGVSYGHAIPAYQWILGHTEAMPTEVLLSTGYGSEYYRGQRRDLFYAQSWALAHYLLRAYGSESFLRMWDRLGAGASVEDAFRATWPQEDYATVAVRAARHGQAIEDHVVLPHEELADSVALVVRTRAPKEIESWLGDRLVQQRRGGPAEAEALYQAALARDPAHAPALAGLAMVAAIRRYPRESAALFVRALASPGATARTARHAAEFGLRALAEDSTSRGPDARPVPARWEPVRRAVARGLALDPTDDRVLEFAGHLARGDSGFAASIVPALEQGHAAAPDQGGIAAALAIALAESGQGSRAGAILAAMPARCRSPRADEALVAIEDDRMRQAHADLLAGRIEEGRRKLVALRADTGDELRRLLIDSTLQGLAEHGRVSDAVQTYNRGVAAVRAGRMDEAIERFEETRRMADDPNLILQAGKRIEEIRAFQARQRRAR